MKRSNLTIIVIVISLLVGGVIGYGYGYGLGKKAITREAPPEVEVSKTALETSTSGGASLVIAFFPKP